MTVLDISDLTTAEIDGTGVFDRLMTATKFHLIEEYNSGRIDGEQYADVYVGALGAILPQAINYIANLQNEKKVDAEVDLIGQKIVTELSQTDESVAGALAAGYGMNDGSEVQGIADATIKHQLMETTLLEQKVVTELGQTSEIKPSDLGQNPSVNIDGLIASKRILDEKQATMVDSQISVSESEKILMGQKIITELAQTEDNIGSGVALGYGLNDGNEIQGAIKSNMNHELMETALLEQKIVTELGQSSDDKPIMLGQNKSSTTIDGLIASKKAIDALQASLVSSEVLKADTEKDLIGQKIITELAQTGDNLDTAQLDGHGFNAVSTVKGLIEGSLTKMNVETALVEQKLVTELGQSSTIKPMALGQNKTSTDIDGLIASKKAIDDLQASLVTSQISTAEREKLLMGQKVVTELAQTDSDLSNAVTYGLNTTDLLGGILKGVVEKNDNEALLVEQKLVTELGQTSATKPTDLGQNKSTTNILGLISTQTEKAEQESVLLAQKAITELAQTSDTVVTSSVALTTSPIVTGVVKQQRDLYEAQVAGFARDAEQKLAKMLIEAWSVNATVGDGSATANPTNQLYDDSLGAVVTKAKAGIGV